MNLEFHSVGYTYDNYELRCRKVGYHHYNISITCGNEQLRSYTNCTDYTDYACPSTDGGKTGSRIYTSPFVFWSRHNSRFSYGSTSETIGEVTCHCDVILYHDSSYTRTKTLNVTGITDIYMHISRTCLIFTTKAPNVTIVASVIRRTINTFTLSFTEITQAEGYTVKVYDYSIYGFSQEIELNGRSNTLITVYRMVPGRRYDFYTGAKRLLEGQILDITGEFYTQHCQSSGNLIPTLLIENLDLIL